jgi:cytochrome P450
MQVQVDFTSPEYLADPAATIARLRAVGPMVEVRLPIIGKVWLTTTQELAARVLKDDKTFTIRKSDGSLAGLQWWMPRVIRLLANNMLTHDEPDHTRLRGIVDEAFRRRAVLDMESEVRAIADRLADDLFADGSPADLIDRYARRLPLLVICELLGLPPGDHARFSEWANHATNVTNVWGFLRMMPALSKIKKYIETRLDDARRGGGSGLIAELIRAESAGDRLTRDETVAMVFLLLFAGHETTTHLISGAVHEILENRELRDWLAQDPERTGLAVEEFLRVISPVQFSKPRFVRRDIDVDSCRLRQGDKVMAYLAAANLDPAANEAPEKIDLARKPNRHIGFGTGIHFCLGHQLARIEGRAALEALMTRWPDLSLAHPDESVRWRRRAGLRAIEQLLVVEGAAAT